MSVAEDGLLRVTQHLVSEVMFGDCVLTGFSGEGRCIEPAAALRWEDGFADLVCEEHAQRAEGRGALVIRPKRHDGSLT